MKFVFRSLLVSMLLLVSAAAAGAISTDAATGPVEDDIQYTPANERGEYNFKITFAEPGMLHAESVRAPGEPFDASSPAAVAYREQLHTQQTGYKQNIAARIGRELAVSHHFMVFDSAIGARMTPEEAEIVSGLSGVASVERERLYDLDTYRGPQFIGADTIWDGTNTPDGSMLRGEDMVIAVLDTGVQESHPSFANDATCGHGGGNDDKLLSSLDCSSTDTGTIGGLCNGLNATDINGHGSHTASTSGGNALDDTAVPAPPVDISGVAPCARIRSYKVCPAQCPGFDIQAGMSSVLIHGDVDVMNFSISGGANPWTDNDRRKLDLVDAGVFVAASAGNTSAAQPNPVGQVNHRGPWVLSVAASTHDGLLANGLSLDGGPQDVPALQGTGPAMVSDFTGDLRYAGDVDAGNFEGCNAFPPGAFAGEAALISRGACNFSVKVDNAVAAGAVFVVVFNNAPGLPIVMGGLEGTAVSSVMVSDVVGADLIAALGGGTAQVTVEAELSDFGDPSLGDVLAGFSFRGPTPAPLQHLQKPDITGPGVNILAAVPGGYGFISGTSMSSPHLAGSATLVRQANPDWTVSEVKSAIQMTASKDGTDDDGTSPWDWDDVGSGRVDLTKAALAGLVMDETTANYLAANPGVGGDVRTLNLAGVRDVDCTPDCTWTRTVRNTLSNPSSWTVSTSAVGFDITVSPTTFSFTGNTSETEELTITATPIGNQTGAVAFGEVILTEDGSLSPDLHITVAISGEEGSPPAIDVDPASLSSTLPAGGSEVQELTISNLGDSDLDWSILDGSGAEVWSDDFDSYVNGSQIHGQGGWFGWLDNPALGAFVSDEQARSAPHSLKVEGDNDPVRPFENVDSGSAVVTAWQYIPAGFSGTTFFIMQNTYNHAGTGLNWSTQVNFDSATNLVTNTGVTGGTLPMITDEWVEIRVEIDFDADTQTFYYGGDELYNGTWTGEVSGGGALNLGAINLFANNASPVYYDDISVTTGLPEGCDAPSELDWLDTAPLSGTTAPAGSTVVDVTFDASTLANGDFEEAVLCISSNDPSTPTVMVPVDLTVGEPGVLAIDPTELDFGDVEAGDSASAMFTVSNAADPGAESIELTGIAASGDPEFAVTGGTCAVSDVLAPGDDCTVEVTFSPAAVGAFTGELAVEADGGDQTATAALSGAGIEIDPAELAVDPVTLDFGGVFIGDTGVMSVTVSNAAAEGAADLVLTEIEVITGGPEFSIGGGDCAVSGTIAPQDSCMVEVHFSPSAEQPFTGFLRIDAEGEGNDAVNVELSGNGVEPTDDIFADRFEEQ